MVNHACNLRCTYCYTGAKFSRAMTTEIGRRAIDRALASIAPGGALELGFFGGEPLLEAELIKNLLEYAAAQARHRRVEISPGITTNGTITTDSAWSVLTRRDVDLSISFDGLPAVHDRHRVTADGSGTSRPV